MGWFSARPVVSCIPNTKAVEPQPYDRNNTLNFVPRLLCASSCSIPKLTAVKLKYIQGKNIISRKPNVLGIYYTHDDTPSLHSKTLLAARGILISPTLTCTALNRRPLKVFLPVRAVTGNGVKREWDGFRPLPHVLVNCQNANVLVAFFSELKGRARRRGPRETLSRRSSGIHHYPFGPH